MACPDLKQERVDYASRLESMFTSKRRPFKGIDLDDQLVWTDDEVDQDVANKFKLIIDQLLTTKQQSPRYKLTKIIKALWLAHVSSLNGSMQVVYYSLYKTKIHRNFLMQAINTLQRNGIIKVATSPDPNRKTKGPCNSITSLFHFSTKFQKLLMQTDVTQDKVPQIPVVIVRDDIGNPMNVNVNGSDEEQTIRAYNHFINQYNVTIHDRKIDSSLTAIFNNDLFHGGRMYSEVTNTPSNQRALLLINGNPTTSSDYTSHQIMMGFAMEYPSTYQHVIQQWHGDAYAYLGNLMNITSRELVKKLVVIGINVNNFNFSTKPQSPLNKWLLTKGYLMDAKSLKDLCRTVLTAKYPRIFKAGKRNGLSYHWHDSRMARVVLKLSMLNQIPVIPVHDEFIHLPEHEQLVREWMAIAFQQITHATHAVINKTIVTSPPSIPHIPNVGWEITKDVQCTVDPSTCTMLKDVWYYLNINKTKLTETLQQKGIIEKTIVTTPTRTITVWKLTKQAAWLGFNPSHGGLNHIKLKPQALMEWMIHGQLHASVYKPTKMHMMTHDKSLSPISEMIL